MKKFTNVRSQMIDKKLNFFCIRKAKMIDEKKMCRRNEMNQSTDSNPFKDLKPLINGGNVI